MPRQGFEVRNSPEERVRQLGTISEATKLLFAIGPSPRRYTNHAAADISFLGQGAKAVKSLRGITSLFGGPLQLGRSNARRCGFETLEPRQMLAADLVPAGGDINIGFTGGMTGSISGSVFANHTAQCEEAVANSATAEMLIQLLDKTGTVIEERLTAADGSYHFADLLPGHYSVRQPGAAETALDTDQLDQIVVEAGMSLEGFHLEIAACDLAEQDMALETLATPIVALSLQIPPPSRLETLNAPTIIETIDVAQVTQSLLSRPRPAEIIGGSSRSLQESVDIKTWEEFPMDHWFSTASYLELVSSEPVTVDELASGLSDTLQETSEVEEAPFADNYTVNTIEWWEGDEGLQLEALIGDEQVIEIETAPEKTSQTGAAKLARRELRDSEQLSRVER